MPCLTKALERLLSNGAIPLPYPQELMTLTRGITSQGGMTKEKKSRRWSSMLRLPVQDPRAVFTGSMAARIW